MQQKFKIPTNFDYLGYKLNNPTLFNYTKSECLEHYASVGHKAKLKYDKNNFSIKDIRMIDVLTKLQKSLPADFCIETYRACNPDISNQNDIWLVHHYMIHGNKERRAYKNPSNSLPKDFDWKEYAKINPDLNFKTQTQYETHYLVYGETEQRLYKLTLPKEYNRTVYRFFNKDISLMSDIELDKHFLLAGKKENRKYNDLLFDEKYISCYEEYTKDIRLIKSNYIEQKISKFKKCITGEVDLVLINHETSLNGATHFLNILKDYLLQFNKKIFLLEPTENKTVFKKYNLIEYENCLVYEQDPSLLFYAIEYLNPKRILINSSNNIFDICYNYLSHRRDNFVFHSHEVKKYFDCIHEETCPNFVVSSLIREQWNNEPNIQPPILTEFTRNQLDQATPAHFIKNEYGKMDQSKIVITMCGALSSRKNYKLFIELAKVFPNYNFLWVGGKDSEGNFQGISNLYHIADTETPYDYYLITDYFLLTTTIDPCPYVILENLYLNNKVIVFKPNIFTQHDKEKLPNLYLEYPEEVNTENASKAIDLFVKTKKIKTLTKEGSEYIIANFSTFSDLYINSLME